MEPTQQAPRTQPSRKCKRPWLVVALVLAGLSSKAGQTANETPRRPNILGLICENMGP